MNANITQTLSEYIAQAKYEDFPKEIIRKSKQLIMDNIGCAIGGYVTDAGKILISFAKEISEKPEATLIGDGAKVSCMISAGVNAQMANVLNFDDTTVTGHPGSAIIQTALSLGEKLGASGKEIIEATVVGYEVTDRIGSGVPTHTPRLRTTPYAIPVSHHVFGASVVAAKILKLDVQQAKHAIGISGAIAPTFNLKRAADSPAGQTKTGNLWNCWTGISAALLARKGFKGPPEYLDGDKGYWALFSDNVDFEAMTADLSSRYLTGEVQIKPWATCRFNQPSFQLVSNIITDEKIDPDDIEEIIVRANTRAAAHPFDVQQPIEMGDAFYSAPWAAAMAVLGYESGPDWFTPERFQDPMVLNLTHKVRTEVLPEADMVLKERGIRKAVPCEVEIRTKSQAYVRRIQGAKGDPDQPLSDHEIKAKYRSLASKCLNKSQVDRIERTIDNLETLLNVSQVTQLFRSASDRSTS